MGYVLCFQHGANFMIGLNVNPFKASLYHIVDITLFLCL